MQDYAYRTPVLAVIGFGEGPIVVKQDVVFRKWCHGTNRTSVSIAYPIGIVLAIIRGFFPRPRHPCTG